MSQILLAIAKQAEWGGGIPLDEQIRIPFWEHTVLIPIYSASVSLLVILLSAILNAVNKRTSVSRAPKPRSYDANRLNPVEEYPSTDEPNQRTKRALFLDSMRAVCCAVLFALSILGPIRLDNGATCCEQPGPGYIVVGTDFTTRLIEFIFCFFYGYITVLSLLSLLPKNASIRSTASYHLTILLLVTFGVYAHRDLYPLALFDGHPADDSLGWLTWARIGLIGFAGIVLPLITPRVAVSRIPNQEEVSSIFALVTHSFLSPLIWKALKMPHLPYEELPVLSEHAQIAHLRAASFPLLDSFQRKSKRHIFFGLLSFFSFWWIMLALTTIAQVLLSFIEPLAIYQILHYVESGGKGATIKPWFWVVALFLGSWLKTINFQWYQYTATRMTVKTEGIFTSLIFEHALRIRAKESTSVNSPGATTPGDDETESAVAHDDSLGSANDTTILIGDSAEAGAGPGPGSGTEPEPEPLATNGDATSTENEGSSNFVGRINNLISSDLDNIVEGRELAWFVCALPIKIGLSISFLYAILGWSAFVGLAFTILTLFVPGLIARLIHNVQVEKAMKTDERVQAITETINVIRMVKAFGWEDKTRAQINERRETELRYIRLNSILSLINMNANWVLPLITLVTVFFSYSVIAKKALNGSQTSVIRSSLHSEFLRECAEKCIQRSFQYLPRLIQSKVSLDRVNDYLQQTELLDSFDKELSTTAPELLDAPPEDGVIGFHNASFTWSKASKSADAPRRDFTLRIEGELLFMRGELNLVVGPTGCGKSSLLLALLGELHFNSAPDESWYKLPRDGGIAYCPQEPWILNLSIKENIVLDSEFDVDRYQAVLSACALDQDLKLFEAGDATEIGERGLTLSGGQKARISLARAVYSSANIVLLDDILSSLDVHTAKAVVEDCILGDLLRDRTVILVTHNLSLVELSAKRVISVSIGGTASVAQSLGDVITRNHVLGDALVLEQEELEKLEQVLDNGEPKQIDPATGKIITEEELAVGRLSMGTIMLYLSSLGGPLFWLSYFPSIILSELSDSWQIWWIGRWAQQYETQPAASVNIAFYLGLFSLSIVFSSITFSTSQSIWIFGGIKASRTIHDRLLRAVLRTTTRVLDRTPTGRIIQRFTKDIRVVDGPLADDVQMFIQFGIIIVQKLLIIVYLTPAFLVPGIVLALLSVGYGHIYMRTQLPVKREMSNAKAPIISHFGTAIQGLTSIRAYGVQDRFTMQSLERIDKYSRIALTSVNLNRWYNYRVQLLGNLFCASLSGYLVYVSKTPASNIGFQLNLAVAFSFYLLIWVRMYNTLEVEANSVERIQAYVNIEQEPAPTKAGEPPAAWPTSGKLRIEKICARYSPDGPDVLHELSFEITSGQKIGVVGRTGSGKSSLTLRLLRLIEGSGEVFFDGIPIGRLNLEALRSNITIIPQQPELLAGSIRQNLDPFDEHSDAILNDTLRAVGLFSLQSDLPEAERISLDSSVSSGGGNFSLGQRQILALARALVRRSKILILDEATASLDHKTDELIQESLKTQFKECTVITIAHRLQTIMDADKVAVLDAGSLVEFASPSTLLHQGGFFKSLVDESSDNEILYKIAQSSAY